MRRGAGPFGIDHRDRPEREWRTEIVVFCMRCVAFTQITDGAVREAEQYAPFDIHGTSMANACSKAAQTKRNPIRRASLRDRCAFSDRRTRPWWARSPLGTAAAVAASRWQRLDELVLVEAVRGSRRPGFSNEAFAAALRTAGVGSRHVRSLGTPTRSRTAAREGGLDRLEHIFSNGIPLSSDPGPTK